MNDIKDGDQSWRNTVRERYATHLIERYTDLLGNMPENAQPFVARNLAARRNVMQARLMEAQRLQSGEITIRDIGENKQLSDAEAEELAELHLRTVAAD